MAETRVSQGICSLTGCEASATRVGMCNIHYRRKLRGWTDLNTKPTAKRQDPAELFWKYVDKRDPDECWEWKGGRTPRGYGKFLYRSVTKAAHRMMWFFTYGEMPELHVLHKCDNPPCVNPSHLFLGTHADNMADKIQKNRHNACHGPTHPKAKLTEADVREIRKLCKNKPFSEIAKMYGVTLTAIRLIFQRQNWKHVT